MLHQPFKDLKIVELSSVLAGPAVGMFFAELGAEVIKIENKSTNGDVTRNWKLPSEQNSDTSAYYKSVNWGKQSMMLDLSDPKDNALVLEMITQADIVLANFKRGSAKNFGLDYESINAIQPTIIYANLTAYGEQSDGVGFDVLLQAETGFLYMNGEADGPPVKMPVALIDLLAAHQLKEAILIALIDRYQNNRSSFISVSLAKSAVASLANQAANYLNEGFIPQRMGSQHPNICPYGDIFETQDGKAILLAVGTEQHFQVLCKILQLPELAIHPKFATNANRVVHRKEMIVLLQNAFKNFKQVDLLNQFTEQKVPAGVINDMQAVFELPYAKEMILEDVVGNKCVKTIAFEIYPSEK
jgi:crotonobetainyl-CoA:carnitine CoA-transferase CaiB-like acyl-CoA transferase